MTLFLLDIFYFKFLFSEKKFSDLYDLSFLVHKLQYFLLKECHKNDAPFVLKGSEVAYVSVILPY